MDQENQLTVTEPRQHHRRSPSSLEMYAACAAYKKDKTADTTKADEGTRLHGYAERETIEGLEPEEAGWVQEVLNYKNILIEELKAAGRGVLVLKEIKLNAFDITDGYGDVVILSSLIEKNPTLDTDISVFDKADIIDYKFGAREVTDAKDNPQAQSYSLGAFAISNNIESATPHFLMPRLGIATVHTFTRADIEYLKLRIQTIIDRSTVEDPIPTPFYFACMTCGRRATCTALHKTVITVSKKYQAVEIPEGPSLEAIIADPDQCAKLLKLKTLMAAWCKAVQAIVTDRVISQEVPMPVGYEIHTSEGRKSFSNGQKIFEIAQSLGITVTSEEIASISALPVTKTEDLIKSKCPRGKKKETYEAFVAQLQAAGCVAYSDSSSYLKATNDKTEEIEIIK